MIAVIAAVLAAACAAASARRLAFVTRPAALDAREVLAWLEARKGGAEEKLAALTRAASATPDASWERDLVEALATEDDDVRAARVNEQLTELDHRLARWSRVPRVCASISASTAFLLATLVVRRGLAMAGDEELASEGVGNLARGLVSQAITVAALGMVGTAFCVAAHGLAGKIAKARAADADKLVETLETLRAGQG